MISGRKYGCFNCTHQGDSTMYPNCVCNVCIMNDNDINAVPTEWVSDDEESIKQDNVNHPQHYKSETGLETIDVIEAFTYDLQGIEATDTGNIIKYICRWKHKNGIEDLKKAKWYLEHLINKVEKKESK